MRTSK